MIVSVRVLVVLGLFSIGVSQAYAQRRARYDAPVQPILVSSSEGPASRYQVVLALVASGDAEMIQDGRLFELSVSEPVPEGSRRRPRTHRCSLPSRPRRLSAEPAVMHAGDRFGVALDLRAICWGRALAAVEAGGEVTVRYSAPRGRGAFVVRAPGEARRTLTSIEETSDFQLPAPEVREVSPVISMGAVDLRSARSATFRVAIRGPEAATRRAWIRPDRVMFRVVNPRGERVDCELPSGGASPIPDLFARISARRASRLSLDGLAYCPEDTFAQAGIYEVTPVLILDEDGEEWNLHALVGTFEGATVPVRVRSGDGSLLRVVSPEDLRRLLR